MELLLVVKGPSSENGQLRGRIRRCTKPTPYAAIVAAAYHYPAAQYGVNIVNSRRDSVISRKRSRGTEPCVLLQTSNSAQVGSTNSLPSACLNWVA